MKAKLESFLQEVCEKTTTNNQYPVLTSSKTGLSLQSSYFNKQVASRDNVGYKVIRRGQFTYRAMSDTGEFFPNMLECVDVGIVSPAYPVFMITDPSIIVPNYLKYYFRSQAFQRSIALFARGSTRTSVKFGSLKTISIDLPTIEQQERDVMTLDHVGALIVNCQRKLSLLDGLVKSRFVEMFGDPVLNPNGYPKLKLSKIASYYGGLTYRPSDVVEEDGTIVLRSANIQNGLLSFEDVVRVSCKIKDKLYVKQNDILMCSRNGSARLVGKTALIKDLVEPMSFGAFMMIIRSEYYPYLLSYLRTQAFRSQVQTGTATINQITGRMLDSVVLPIPPIQLVREFASFVQQVDKSRFAVQQAIEQLETLKASLMQKYFG